MERPNPPENAPDRVRGMSNGLDLHGRHIVLGLTGGVACYKAAELARELGLGYATLAMVVNYAAGVSAQPITLEQVPCWLGMIRLPALNLCGISPRLYSPTLSSLTLASSDLAWAL